MLKTSDFPVLKRAQPDVRQTASGSHGRSPSHFSRPEKLYLLVAAIEAVIVTAIVLAAFLLVQTRVSAGNKHALTVAVYMAVFILARLFSCFYSFDALRARNTLVLHIIFQLGMLAYAIAEIPQTRLSLQHINRAGACVVLPAGHFDCLGKGTLYDLLKKLLIVPPIVIGLATVVYFALVRRLAVQFGWDVYRLVNASPEQKSMLRIYQTMVSQLKLVAFFASAFCMAYIILVTTLWQDKAEFVITIIALPLFYPTLLVCGWALRRENKPLMSISLFLFIVGEAYFVYKLVSLWLPRTAWIYKHTRITLAVLSAITIVILASTIVNGVLCMANSGRGLLAIHDDPANHLLNLSVPRLMKTKHDEAEGCPRVEERLVID